MTNDELVMKLQENGVIKHEKVMKAFKFTDRGDFVPCNSILLLVFCFCEAAISYREFSDSKRNSAYSDRPFKSER